MPEGVPIYVLPHELIDRLVGFPFHRGVLACASAGRRRRSRRSSVGSEPAFLVICPKLTDPENLGAIARIGDVFGIDAILAGPSALIRSRAGSCACRWGRSSGARHRSPSGSATWTRLVERLRPATVGRRGRSVGRRLTIRSPSARLGLVLGDEDQGIEPGMAGAMQRAITIPMRRERARSTWRWPRGF